MKVVSAGGRPLTKIKKGAGASPLRQLTPQNQNTVEVVFRPPREANIFICRSRVQVGCQPPGYAQFEFIRLKRWELAKGNHLGTRGKQAKSYKISQMASSSSPFFGRRGRRKESRHVGFVSNSNRRANRRRNRFAEPFDVCCVLGFDHYPRQRFRARVTQYDPSVAAEG